ncbi:DNA polymerase-3 subunit delta' [Dethiosulfovibrio salsuginis]|uniref:DNA polymerase-3 subunit delta n=1 Tax=Dethiosulfovibrio salsuginis TaxID=561720 RepID=A0A1X7I9W9_9BACT|nr:DNA polymerase-3 subunit delta' [Dethiosulfovibrio salsuginis]
MLNIPAFLKSSPLWLNLKDKLAGEVTPSAIALCLSGSLHSALLLEISKIMLCLNKDGCGRCLSCMAWSEGSHPDLIVSSEQGPPSVDQCREMIDELHLKAVVSSGRIGVVPCADKLNINSANSLLKITEEPPAGCRLIFLMEENRLIPTLRSRIWTIVFPEEDTFPPLSPPSGKAQWMGWLERISSFDREQLILELQGFIGFLVQKKLYLKASNLSQLIFLAGQTNLSVSMMGDMVFLLIEEEYPFESVFDRIW